MADLDINRIALVATGPANADTSARPREELATGYFLTGDLVLTAHHIADTAGSTFSVRSEVGATEEERWSDAEPVWNGVGDVDAMLFRTSKWFGDWETPTFAPNIQRGGWKSSGYAKLATDSEQNNRKTQPLDGSFDLSLGQGAPELALTTEQNIASQWDDHWRGISGAPVFSASPAGDGIVGIITDANRALSNGLIGLPISRLLDDLRFRLLVAPSFLEPLPTRPFCLVLTAEGSRPDLVERVAGVLTGHRDEDVLFGELIERPIPIRVVDAVKSVENWAVAVDALARADFMVADVTSFEPAVMLLLGIRSVLRRGVTVSVTAGDLRSDGESDTKFDGNLPFNVQETRVLSYDDDHFYDDLHRAMAEGAANLARDANYLDLPAFHAVRAPRPETWADYNVNNLLVLCPFGKSYSDFYRKKLREVIRAHIHKMTPLRMLDLRSPRLVGQALYEQIRWASHCLVDWSEWRANVMFELGVRLASSDHDPLSIIDVADVRRDLSAGAPSTRSLEQHHLLCELFKPVTYDRATLNPDLGNPIENWWARQRTAGPRASQGAIPSGGTFGIAQASFLWQQDPMLTRPHVELREGAERIVGKDQERLPEPLILFADNDAFNSELTASVMEKWIAAWLYLRHLASAEDADGTDVRTDFLGISPFVLNALKASSEPRHVALRKEIRELLKAERAQQRARAGGADRG